MTYLEEYKIKRKTSNRDIKAIELFIEADKKIEELDGFNVGLATESHEYQTRVKELEQQIVAAKEWQRKAFLCYPNIDLDIEKEQL